MTSPCLQHATNPISSYCVRCGRSMCELCTFWVGSALFCPECLSSGPSADERAAVTTRGMFSLGLAVLGLIVLVGDFALVRLVPPDMVRVVDMLLTKVVSLIAMGGIALGLIGREGARRTGSMLPLIGVVMNGAVIVILALLVLATLLQRNGASWL